VIDALALTFGFVLARVAAFVAVLPILDGAKAPRSVKMGLTMALTIFFILQDGVASPALLGRASTLTWLGCALILAREAILGAFLGYAMGLILLPVKIAGQYLGQEMGLAMGQLLGPTSTAPSAVISTLFEILATMLLLGLDGHHLFLTTFRGTFTRYPIGGVFEPPPVDGLVEGLARSQEWGMGLAAPLGGALFVTTIVLAILSRSVPQMNLFSVGFSLRVTVGLGGAYLLLPDLIRGMVQVFGRYNAMLQGLV
jgi:flagellar biosynthesis protein FliR